MEVKYVVLIYIYARTKGKERAGKDKGATSWLTSLHCSSVEAPRNSYHGMLKGVCLSDLPLPKMNSTNVPDTLEYHTTLGIDSKPSGATTPASQQPLVPAPVLDETPPYPILPRWHRILLISLLASSNLIDSSSLFNSLPGMYQMESELKMTVPAGQWMLNGWNMGVAISLLVSGRFADVYGAKWVYLVGERSITEVRDLKKIGH